MRNITGMCLFSCTFLIVRGACGLDKKKWSPLNLYFHLERSSSLCAMCHLLAKLWTQLLSTWVMLTYILDVVTLLIWFCPFLGISQFFWRMCAGDRKIFSYHHGFYCRNISLMSLLIVGLFLFLNQFWWVLSFAVETTVCQLYAPCGQTAARPGVWDSQECSFNWAFVL